MAVTKEAIAIVLDVCPGMATGSCLVESLQIINMVLQRKLFSESKDEVMLILFGTPTSNNDLVNGDEYAHITVEKTLSPVTFEIIEFIQTFDIDLKGVSADYVDALVVAMDELKKNTENKKAFVSKRIVLFSNLREKFKNDQLEDIIASMKESHFDFNYIGPCLDDIERENLNSQATNGEVRNLNEKRQLIESRDILQKILDQTSGEHFSLSELLPCLSFIQSRNIKSTAWKSSLKIGTSLDIPICLFIRLKEQKFKSFKNVCSANIEADIERSRSFHLSDEKQTEVDKNDVIEGHRYGSTLVPFSADDKEAMKVKSEKCFKVLGFTKLDNVKRYQYLGDSVWVCIAEKDNETAQLSLSALINALYETNMVAIVRRVSMNGGLVRIGCLFPHIKSKYECLFYVELPFAEDLHQSTFKSLPLMDISKRSAPSEDQLNVINKLIDSMDLSGTRKEDDDNQGEIFKPKLLFNPYLQHLYQCLEHRALHPSDSLPKLNPILSTSLQPPQSVIETSKQTMTKLPQLFKLNFIEPDKDKKPEVNDSSVCRTELETKDVKRCVLDKPEGTGSEKFIGSCSTSTDDFIAMVSKLRHDFHEASTQVQKKILQLVDEGSLHHNIKVLESVGILRNESIKDRTATSFNGFLLDLKKSLQGNNCNLFLSELSKNKLGLITKDELDCSDVSTEQAIEFLLIHEGRDKKDETVNIDGTTNLS